MSARNTFVTSYIYWPEAIKIINVILQDVVDDMQFIGKQDHAGYFAGLLKTVGGPPLMLEDILKQADKELATIGYHLDFNMAIVCDDLPHAVLSRFSLYGLGTNFEAEEARRIDAVRRLNAKAAKRRKAI